MGEAQLLEMRYSCGGPVGCSEEEAGMAAYYVRRLVLSAAGVVSDVIAQVLQERRAFGPREDPGETHLAVGKEDRPAPSPVKHHERHAETSEGPSTDRNRLAGRSTDLAARVTTMHARLRHEIEEGGRLGTGHDPRRAQHQATYEVGCHAHLFLAAASGTAAAVTHLQQLSLSHFTFPSLRGV